MVVNFFRSNTAEYEVRVQLCTDRAEIEDATVAWPSPECGVAKIAFLSQHAGTPERRVYGDDSLSFTSWRGLAAHRPWDRSIASRKRLVRLRALSGTR